MNRLKFLATLLLCLGAAHASAQQKLRVQVNQRGDIALIGNTLGWDCANDPEPPVVGTVDTPFPFGCGLTPNDTSPDIAWRADEPVAGQALASARITAAQSRTTAVLNLPRGATVTHAFLYWSARRSPNSADTTAILERPGVFTQSVTATTSYVVPEGFEFLYQSVADVTATVRANGNGAYRVSGVDVSTLFGTDQDVLYGAWALLVLYERATDPVRNLAVFDGFDYVSFFHDSSISLSGFVVPNSGYDAKLAVIAYEGDYRFGDSQILGADTLSFGVAPLTEADRLSDGANPVRDFFNGTRSYFGAPVSVAGDLPQLTGNIGSMAGIDIDVVDVTSRVKPGQTRVDVLADSELDVFMLGAFATSISTLQPDFITSTKTVRDVNGGATFVGDELEYTITVSNTGTDASSNTIVVDPLPADLTYVAGSLSITSGPNAGAKTDATGDDQADFDAAQGRLTVRLGAGANATAGGSINAGDSSVFTFRARVAPTAKGVISNQASITATGVKGAPATTTVTDGNVDAPGNTPTEIPTGTCTGDNQCSGATPYCNLSKMPNICVECTTDAQCGPGATCNLLTNKCVCPAAGCLIDTDDDGISDPDEIKIGTDPNDADSDDDGAADGKEIKPGEDSDGDGLINALDPDSDDDGLYDGTELGFGCDNKGTNKANKHCIPDGDLGATKTDPIDEDTDDGSVIDGSEDVDRDGVVDPGERDPTKGHGADDLPNNDTDNDGLSNDLEDKLGSDPNDADTDNDGLSDGDEKNPADDTDGDGKINLLDPDSDNDGLFDGTEAGKDCGGKGTTPGPTCIPDADKGATTTSVVVADTDGGGAKDGDEDTNKNGAVDPGERNPTVGHPEDDDGLKDTDGDGLTDPEEDAIGTDKIDGDSDDDGVPDGKEIFPGVDSDGDGKVNALDPDSDNDGLFDGTEQGLGCDTRITNISKGLCIPDADMGATTTSPINADNDGGGTSDGDEDTNKNGAVDPGERDPNLACDDAAVGACDANGNGNGNGGSGANGFGSLAGGGGCNVGTLGGAGSAATLLLGAASLLLARRRRRRN